MELEIMLMVRVLVEIATDGPRVERCEVIECIPVAPAAVELMAQAEAARPAH